MYDIVQEWGWYHLPINHIFSIIEVKSTRGVKLFNVQCLTHTQLNWLKFTWVQSNHVVRFNVIFNQRA